MRSVGPPAELRAQYTMSQVYNERVTGWKIEVAGNRSDTHLFRLHPHALSR